MKVGLNYRSELGPVPHLVDELDNVTAGIRGSWLVEHKDDNSHGAVSADSLVTTGDVTVGGDLRVEGTVPDGLDFGAEGETIVLSGTRIALAAPETRDEYSAFPSLGASSDNVTAVLQSTRHFVPTDTSQDIGYKGDTDRRWRNGLFFHLVQAPYLSATTGLYERLRDTAVGVWITVAYAAGNFTASAGTWTVSSGNQAVYKYMLVGKTMTVAWVINATSLSAVCYPRIAIPGGYLAQTVQHGIVRALDTVAAVAANASVAAGGAYIEIARDVDGNTWTAGANRYTSGTFSFEVQ